MTRKQFVVYEEKHDGQIGALIACCPIESDAKALVNHLGVNQPGVRYTDLLVWTTEALDEEALDRLKDALQADKTVVNWNILPKSSSDRTFNALVLRKLAVDSWVVHTANLIGTTPETPVSYFCGHYHKTEAEAGKYFDERIHEIHKDWYAQYTK